LRRTGEEKESCHAAAAGVSPDDMLITLYEVPGENISFGQGEAQRAKAAAHA
jgi:4-oxalocrotonate tautomerase